MCRGVSRFIRGSREIEINKSVEINKDVGVGLRMTFVLVYAFLSF